MMLTMMAGQMAYYCNILFLLLALLLVGPNAADNPCETIASNTKVAQEGIRCIGRVGSDLLVVTHKLTVWLIEAKDIDKEGEDKPINSLYFGGDPPVPIEEKWPLIKDKEHNQIIDWDKLKAVTKTCNPAVDVGGKYLMIDGVQDDHNHSIITRGLRWDIDKNVGWTGLLNNHTDPNARWISSSELAKQYMFTDRLGALKVIRYSACWLEKGIILDNFTHTSMGYVKDDNEHCEQVDEPPYHPLCLSGTNQVYVGKQGGSCKGGDRPAQWNIFTGFVDKGHFYLMTNDSVISFPETAYNKSAASTFHNIPYGSFIKCSANPHPRDVGAGKKKALTIGLIVALALILLICCLCILLCLVREAMARRKKKDKHGKSGGKGGKGAKGFFGGGTARSGGLLSPLGLSKKISSVSKRSTGGLKPGKKLTGAGGSVRTKRSTTPNKRGGSLSRKPSAGATRRSKGVSGAGGGGPSTGSGATRRSKGAGGSSKGRMTSSGKGPSKAETARSRNISGRSKSGKRSRRPSRGTSGNSNKATERSKLKNR